MEVFVMAIPVSKPAMVSTYGKSSVVVQGPTSRRMMAVPLSTNRLSGAPSTTKVSPSSLLVGWKLTYTSPTDSSVIAAAPSNIISNVTHSFTLPVSIVVPGNDIVYDLPRTGR